MTAGGRTSLAHGLPVQRAHLRSRSVLLLLGLACGWLGLSLPAHAFDPTLVPVFADRVVVKKAERRLLLLKDGHTLAEYPISLGRSPKGHKQQAGDSRTPEGIYRLDYRKPNSAFHLALHVSYPNAQDIAEARRRGVKPGDNIMIHGLPNWYRGADEDFPFRDWTDGCIALSNRHMQLVYDLVPDDTTIEILP